MAKWPFDSAQDEESVIGYLDRLSSSYLRLLAVCVSLLTNRWVLYHKTGQISRQFVKNVEETALPPSLKLWRRVPVNWLIGD
jgi:hypothetical protein